MNIYLTSARAHAIAASNWGSVNTTYKTTGGKGVYYFSCASHGGYIVDGHALTPEQRENIDQHIKPYLVYVVLDRDTGLVKKFQNPFSFKGMRYSRSDALVADHPLYVFEEDCAWSLLEKFTPIRRTDAYKDLDGHEEAIESSFNSWYANKSA